MSQTLEQTILEMQVPALTAEGYDVFVQPGRGLRPEFLGNHLPDAIALRKDKNLIVEVMKESPESSKRLKDIQILLDGQDGWELKVIWVGQTAERRTLEIQPDATIRQSVEQVGQVAALGHTGPALLLAWAAFEALARSLVVPKFERPQTPGRLVEVLAGEGYLTPKEASHMRIWAQKRNSLIHGELQIEVSQGEIDSFLSILHMLLTFRVQ
jgi:uncharacterized protein YutE (UPF0331/DUF86 family)